MSSGDHYDFIIIGSGAGGGTLALTLAPSGKRILILERGDYLPREKQNWDPTDVFVKNRYVSKDTWYDRDGLSQGELRHLRESLRRATGALARSEAARGGEIARLRAENDLLHERAAEIDRRLEEAQAWRATLEQIYQSRTWKLHLFLERLRGRR